MICFNLKVSREVVSEGDCRRKHWNVETGIRFSGDEKWRVLVLREFSGEKVDKRIVVVQGRLKLVSKNLVLPIFG